MKPYDLKYAVEAANPNSRFFSRANMKFAGDTMRNYGVAGPVEITTNTGERLQAYELFRRRPVKHGLSASAYFCASTFRQTFPART